MSRDKNDALTTLSRKEVLEVIGKKRPFEIDMRKANPIKVDFSGRKL